MNQHSHLSGCTISTSIRTMNEEKQNMTKIEKEEKSMDMFFSVPYVRMYGCVRIDLIHEHASIVLYRFINTLEIYYKDCVIT